MTHQIALYMAIHTTGAFLFSLAGIFGLLANNRYMKMNHWVAMFLISTFMLGLLTVATWVMVGR